MNHSKNRLNLNNKFIILTTSYAPLRGSPHGDTGIGATGTQKTPAERRGSPRPQRSAKHLAYCAGPFCIAWGRFRF